jgi:phosphatidylinositol glycan class K
MSLLNLFLLSLAIVNVLGGFADNYKNNWYVLVDTSRYIFNYRHFSNMMGIYNRLKTYGIKDDRIIMAAPLTYACDPRNRKPGNIYIDEKTKKNNYCLDPQIDVRGEDLNEVSVINIIKGLYEPYQPLSQKLLSDENSDIMFYFSGHSGDEFFKIQDSKVLYARDIGIALDIAYKKKKYKRIMFISDTCEAFSWFNYVQAPNIMYQASSGLGESALSHGYDEELNNSLSDKYSYLLVKYLNDRYRKDFKHSSVQSFYESFDRVFLEASPFYNSTLVNTTLANQALINFFPPPFTTESPSLNFDTLKYSVFERIKHESSAEEYKIAGDFIDSL